MGWLIAAAVAGVVIAAASAGVGIYSAQQQAAAQRKTQKFQEEARLNEAESARQSAAYEEHQFRRRLSILMGEQSSIAAATNLDPSQGTPLLLELDTARQGELEALNIRKTGEESAQGHELEAQFARFRSSYATSSANNASLTSGLQGAGSILSSWSTMKGYNRPSSYKGYSTYGLGGND